jgi:DNA-binding CsgD family transcriptional regulator
MWRDYLGRCVKSEDHVASTNSRDIVLAVSSARVAGTANIAEQFGLSMLRICLAIGAAFALLDFGYSIVGVAHRPALVIVALLTSAAWVWGLVWFERAARYLRRPWTVAVAVAVVSVGVAAAGTWNNPCTNELFAMMGVAAVVESNRRVLVCVLLAMTGHVGGLLVAGYTPTQLVDSSHIEPVVNVLADFALFALVLLLALGACRRVLGTARESLDFVRGGGYTITRELGVALRRADDAPLARLPPARAVDIAALLNGRELELVRQLGSGLLPKEIAHRTGTPMLTIRSRIASAKRKTGARTIEQLVGLIAEAELSR